MGVDTLVDPIELVSSSHMLAASPSAGPRASMPSLDPDAQVQWFSRVFDDEPPSVVDVEIAWDEENDTAPTLVIRRRAKT
jgi:hypothetical protein